MNAIIKTFSNERYARCVATSKRVRWDIEEDVIRGRRFDAAHKFLPDGLSWPARLRPCRPMRSGSRARFRAAPTPMCSGWSNASSMPSCWN